MKSLPDATWSFYMFDINYHSCDIFHIERSWTGLDYSVLIEGAWQCHRFRIHTSMTIIIIIIYNQIVPLDTIRKLYIYCIYIQCCKKSTDCERNFSKLLKISPNLFLLRFCSLHIKISFACLYMRLLKRSTAKSIKTNYMCKNKLGIMLST